MINLRDMEKFARKCDVTGKGMNAGYVVGNGEMYFSEEKYLIDWLRSRGGMDGLSDEFILNESYNQEEYYYTEWEEVDEDFFFDADGNKYHEVDGFVWNVVSKEKAIELFESGKEVFKIYSDGSEALVEDELDFLDSEVTYGVEIK